MWLGWERGKQSHMSPRATLVPHEYKPPGTFPCSRSTQLSLGWARETAGHPAGAAGLARQPCRPPSSAKLAPWTCSGSPLLSAGHTHRPAETGSPSGCAPAHGKAGGWTKWRLQDHRGREEGGLVCAGPGGTVTGQFPSCSGHCFPLERMCPPFREAPCGARTPWGWC